LNQYRATTLEQKELDTSVMLFEPIPPSPESTFRYFTHSLTQSSSMANVRRHQWSY